MLQQDRRLIRGLLLDGVVGFHGQLQVLREGLSLSLSLRPPALPVRSCLGLHIHDHQHRLGAVPGALADDFCCFLEGCSRTVDRAHGC